MVSSEKQYKVGQWRKGVSGNPAGRPRKQLTITSRLREYLEKHPLELDKIIRAFVATCQRGETQAIRELLDRLEGKVAEKHEIEGQLPIKLVFQPIVRETKELEGQAIDGEYKVLDEPEPS